MLDAPDKRLFIGIGGLEAASQLLGFIGASKLPGICLLLVMRKSAVAQLLLGDCTPMHTAHVKSSGTPCVSSPQSFMSAPCDSHAPHAVLKGEEPGEYNIFI